MTIPARPWTPGGRGVTIQRAVLSAVCAWLSAAYRISRTSPRVWRWLARGYVPVLDRLARVHAGLVCRLAALDVPAYADFVAAAGVARPRQLSDFPETTKDNYVRAYDDAARCRGGDFATVGTVVDESSGSSGTPMNWLRGRRELSDIRRNLACYVAFAFPSQRLIVVNAYSMGAWATGTTTGAALARVAMVKNTGPDIDKIVGTLDHFGPEFDYLITAYPPFLKHLRDHLDAVDFEWDSYRIDGLVGGEPLTEALRDYLEERFQTVRSAYGASDLTIGIGAESPLTVWLRKRLSSDQELRRELLGADEQRTPMIFHYNPLETYLESNAAGELLCTITGSGLLAPRLRYNVGDEGHVMGFDEIVALLKRRPDLWPEAAGTIDASPMRLPLLLLFGRADSTVSYMGANLYAQDVEHGLYTDNPWAAQINRFVLSLHEGDDLETRPTIAIELRAGATLDSDERDRLAATCRRGVLAHLAQVSRDFAQSLAEDPSASDLRVVVHPAGTGPFTDGDRTIKNRYLVTER